MESFCGIAEVGAWSALDSRGTPTVAAHVTLTSGASGCALAPSGASSGSHEAFELRDGGERYGGRGVLTAVSNVRDVLRPRLLGLDARDRSTLDALMRQIDGTDNFRSLGANAVLAVSLATALAVADHDRLPLYRSLLEVERLVLPMPMVNIISGGAHAARVLDIQDVLVIPLGAACFAQAIEWCWEVRRAAASLIQSTAGRLTASLVADEGGLAAQFRANEEAIDLVAQAISAAGLSPGTDVALALDVAATQFYDPATGDYVLATEDRRLTTDQMCDLIQGWCLGYPIASVEDPLAEDDWTGWSQVSELLGGRVQLIGDDLFVTNGDRLAHAVELGVANSVLVKPNQAGSLEAARRTLTAARMVGYSTVVSARSGDTEDSWLADLAVAWGAGQIKVGSVTRSERLAKYNRLLQIEAEEGANAEFAGAAALTGAAAQRVRD